VGMGQAGTGIAMGIRAMLKEEGLSDEEAPGSASPPLTCRAAIEGDPLLEIPQEQPLQCRVALQGWKPG